MNILTIMCYVLGDVQHVVVNGIDHVVPTIGKTATLVYVFEKMFLGHYDIVVLYDDDVEISKDFRGFASRMTPELGVICGNRNFTRTDTLANATQHVWGVFARPVMRLCSIPWGGLMAIRSELIPDFIELWKTSVFDDTAAPKIAKKHGLEFRFASGYETTPDHNPTTFASLWEFVIRQYADVRKIGPVWSLLTAWLLTITLSVLAWSYMGLWAPLVYFGMWLYPPVNRSLRTLLAIPIAQFLFLVGVPVAMVVPSMKWKHLNVDLVNNEIKRRRHED